MIAEYVLAALILVFCAGFVIGDVAAREHERRAARARVDRLRRLYVGAIREW